jgi:hypothetical protein
MRLPQRRGPSVARRGWRPTVATVCLAAVAAAAVSFVAARPASAYVQYQIFDKDTGMLTGVYFHWTRSCVQVTAYPNDITEMTRDQVMAAATGAAGVWSTSALPCTFIDVQVSASSEPTRTAQSDYYNVLVFRNPWCDPAHPELCQPDALALTSVWGGKKSGTISNADIEVNTEFFVWGDLATQPANGKQDLQNALTHEMGHLLGLDHNCFTPSTDPARQTNNLGQLVPDCFNAPQAIQDATMYTKAEPGDLAKRTLTADDQQAMCDLYPAAKNPNYCPAPGPPAAGCSCAIPGGGGLPAQRGAGTVAGWALALGLTMRRRRRDRAVEAALNQ